MSLADRDAAVGRKSGGRTGRWGVALRVLVTVALMGYFALRLQWGELLQHLRHADPGWLVAGCACFGVATTLGALRWWFLLRVQGIAASVRLAIELTFIGQFFNAFMLGAIGGDLVKGMYIVVHSPGHRTRAALSVVVDRALGLLVLVAATLLLFPWHAESMAQHPELLDVVRALAWLAAGSIVAGATLLFVPFERAPHRWRAAWRRLPLARFVEAVVIGVKQHARAPGFVMGAFACATLLCLVLVMAGVFIARAIHLDVGFVAMLAALTVAICMISLPISIAGHGVREGAFVLMFGALGIVPPGSVQEVGILFSVLFFVLNAVWSVVGGVVYLGFRRHGAPAALYDRTQAVI